MVARSEKRYQVEVRAQPVSCRPSKRGDVPIQTTVVGGNSAQQLLVAWPGHSLESSCGVDTFRNYFDYSVGQMWLPSQKQLQETNEYHQLSIWTTFLSSRMYLAIAGRLSQDVFLYIALVWSKIRNHSSEADLLFIKRKFLVPLSCLIEEEYNFSFFLDNLLHFLCTRNSTLHHILIHTLKLKNEITKVFWPNYSFLDSLKKSKKILIRLSQKIFKDPFSSFPPCMERMLLQSTYGSRWFLNHGRTRR